MPPKTMPAIICRAPEDYRLEEHPVPTAGPGDSGRIEVLVRVESVGICASDLKCYLGAPLFWAMATRIVRATARPHLIIPGHEFVGEVVELGEGAGVQKNTLSPVRWRQDRIGADRPLWRMSILSARAILDVRRARHLWIPAGDLRPGLYSVAYTLQLVRVSVARWPSI